MGSPEQDTPPRVSSSFPAARGVVEFLGADGSTLLLAATGHMRSFIAQRLGESEGPSPRADLAPVTARIVAWPTGSALESDWIVLERSRSALPEQYRKLCRLNRVSILVLDPEKGTWRVEDTMGVEPGGLAGPKRVAVGPIQTAKAGAALGEALDDAYELCRFPKELALAPNGCACAYKQMGRCPGACDGSESMGAYLGRFARAADVASKGLGAWKRGLEAEIRCASAGLDFERAQTLQRRLQQAEKLPADALAFAGAMDRLCCACVSPSVRKGWAQVWILGGEGLIPLLSASAATPADQIEALIEAHASPIGWAPIQLDRFALIARHWMTRAPRARRRHVCVLDLRDPDWAHALKQALSSACEPVESSDDEEHTHIRG